MRTSVSTTPHATHTNNPLLDSVINDPSTQTNLNANLTDDSLSQTNPSTVPIPPYVRQTPRKPPHIRPSGTSVTSPQPLSLMEQMKIVSANKLKKREEARLKEESMINNLNNADIETQQNTLNSAIIGNKNEESTHNTLLDVVKTPFVETPTNAEILVSDELKGAIPLHFNHTGLISLNKDALYSDYIFYGGKGEKEDKKLTKAIMVNYILENRPDPLPPIADYKPISKGESIEKLKKNYEIPHLFSEYQRLGGTVDKDHRYSAKGKGTMNKEFYANFIYNNNSNTKVYDTMGRLIEEGVEVTTKKPSST